jgi:AraC-like DNA-binding protein
MTQFIRSEALVGYSELVTELGGDPDALLASRNFSSHLLSQSGSMISYRSFIGLLEDTAEQLQCEDFGLRFSKCQDFSVLGPIALAAKQGENLAQVLQRVMQFMHVYSPGITLSLNDLPQTNRLLFSLEISLTPLPKCRQTTELNLGIASQTISFLSEGRSKPLGVYFPHDQGATDYAYRSIFACHVNFSQAVAGLEMNKQDLMIPIRRQDERLGELAYQYLQKHFSNDDLQLKEKVRALIKPLLMANQCTNQSVSRALGLQVRTLHRRLAVEHTSFVKVKDGVRKEMALQYLAQAGLPLGQVAILLGYAEQSAFSRSFQGWFNMGPREYRKELQGRL